MWGEDRAPACRGRKVGWRGWRWCLASHEAALWMKKRSSCGRAGACCLRWRPSAAALSVHALVERMLVSLPMPTRRCWHQRQHCDHRPPRGKDVSCSRHAEATTTETAAAIIAELVFCAAVSREKVKSAAMSLKSARE